MTKTKNPLTFLRFIKIFLKGTLFAQLTWPILTFISCRFRIFKKLNFSNSPSQLHEVVSIDDDLVLGLVGEGHRPALQHLQHFVLHLKTNYSGKFQKVDIMVLIISK